MDEEVIIQPRKWLSKEEARKLFPSNEGKWKYECYICGARSIGEGELFKSCDCNHGPTIKCYRP